MATNRMVSLDRHETGIIDRRPTSEDLVPERPDGLPVDVSTNDHSTDDAI